MAKDDMKNEIRRALKNPILQQGFENLCKNLAELEKENAELNMAEADLATVAYMQGAERYKPKWHNVAGGDLPPEDTIVLALMYPNEICIAHFYRRNVWDKIGTVIAWCEIPEYTEE